MKRINLYSIVIRVHVLLIVITFLGMLYVTIIRKPDYLIAFLTIPMINLLLIPITRKDEKFDPSHPVFMILVSLILGTVLRSFFIISPLQSPNKDLMLLGKPPIILLSGIFCIYIGLICFTLGFVCRTKPLPDWSGKKIFRTTISMKKFIPLSILLTIISLVVAVIHYKTLGVNFSDVNDISKKRFYEVDEGSYAALGYDHLFMSLVEPVFYILLMYMVQKRKSVFSFLGLFVFFLGILNILYPFIQSSRTSALYVLINIGLIIYYLKGGIKWRQLAQVFLIATSILIIMTMLRHKSNNVQITSSDQSNPLVIMVGSLNFLGVDKTTQIVEGVPAKMNYQMGSI